MNPVIKVTQDLLLSSNLVLPQDSILVFEGGSYSSGTPWSVSIIGNNTKLVAPPYHIFKNRVKLEGTWIIDKAYPQWFGAVGYSTAQECAAGVSSQSAINDAIQFIGTGEVFLLPGMYKISYPINIPRGIQLIGTQGNNVTSGELGVTTTATVFLLNPSYAEWDIEDKIPYMIGMNVTNNNNEIVWDHHYPSPFTCIKNIQIKNLYMVSGNFKEDEIPIGIYMGVGALVENVMFYNIPRAIKYTRDYIDLKQIRTCVYWNSVKTVDSEGNKVYPIAFDIPGNGDGLQFVHNTVEGDNCQCLRISQCGGASITDNILNGSVEIVHSKGILFASNHMESYNSNRKQNSQLRIYCSEAVVTSNYFEKGEVESVVIKGERYGKMSNVLLQNNEFSGRSVHNIVGNGQSVTGSSSSVKWEKSICEYDVLISSFVNVSIQNCFRNWFQEVGHSDSHPTGILLKKTNREYGDTNEETTVPFTEFNDFSYAFSHSSKISRGEILNPYFKVDDTNPSLTVSMAKSSHAYWIGQNGTYSYRFQLVWDKNRKIVNSSGIRNITGQSSNNLTMQMFEQNGVQIRFSSPTTHNLMVRIVRKRVNGSQTEYAYLDIPICGGEWLYDTGYSLNGYKWISIPAENFVSPANNSLTSMLRQGENVQCTSLHRTEPTYWVIGDSILNVNPNDTSWEILVIKHN